MLIKCPSCPFERTVPDSSFRPGKAYKVTCPKCGRTFPFSIPAGTEKTEEAPAPENGANGPAAARMERELATQSGEPLSAPAQENEPAAGGQEASPSAPAPDAAGAEPADCGQAGKTGEQDGGAAAAPSGSGTDDGELSHNATVGASRSAGNDGKTERSGLLRLPTEEEGDDPLPQGAVIPELQKHAENHATADSGAERQQPAAEDHGLLAGWRRIRENLRRYDESRENETEEPDGRPAGAPWENPQYYGVLGSFSRTLLGAMFRPRDFFRHLRCTNPVLQPIFFYVLLCLFQMLSQRLWTMKALSQLSRTSADPQMMALAETLMQSMNLPLMLLVTPFFSIFQAVLIAGLCHLMIRLTCPSRADFTLTLRVICYSSAPLVLCIVPMFGSALASVWFTVLTFLGCMYALNLSFFRALGALLPLYFLEIIFVMQLNGLIHAM